MNKPQPVGAMSRSERNAAKHRSGMLRVNLLIRFTLSINKISDEF
jgi:hypothetical protein